MFRHNASPRSLGLIRFAAVAAVSLAAYGPARALEAQDFVVADDDGYGIADCMRPGATCGGVIADAWCEAHGHGHADNYGLAEDATASTKVSASSTAASLANAVVIRCSN